MAYDNTQKKPGHLHDTSTNPTKRTGRPDGTEPLRKDKDSNSVSDTYPHTKSSNPTKRTGREVKGQHLRGTVKNQADFSVPVEDVSAKKVSKVSRS